MQVEYDRIDPGKLSAHEKDLLAELRTALHQSSLQASFRVGLSEYIYIVHAVLSRCPKDGHLILQFDARAFGSHERHYLGPQVKLSSNCFDEHGLQSWIFGPLKREFYWEYLWNTLKS